MTPDWVRKETDAPGEMVKKKKKVLMKCTCDYWLLLLPVIRCVQETDCYRSWCAEKHALLLIVAWERISLVDGSLLNG